MSAPSKTTPALPGTGASPASAPARKRVLFVDDETNILDLFCLMFNPATTPWDASYATSGKAALALMETQPFDVLVSDMRMPGMNGAELLSEVMERHPMTARLILSGYADQEEVARSVSAAHQFLRKPCDSLKLQSTLNRMCALDVFLDSDKLKALASKMTIVPSIPGVYFKVMQELESSRSSAESIGEIVAQDPSMTAKLLQLVNSAFFGISRKIAHPVEAVQLLGVGTVRSLALTIHAFSCFEQSKMTAFSVGALWNHSLETGVVARQLTRLAGFDAALAEEAFVAGLLHDLGKLMLAANLPQPYGEVLQAANSLAIPLVEAEQRTFQADHAALGGYLLGLWGLPVSIVEAVALHHTPRKAATRTFCPLTAVHVANAIQHARASATDETRALQLDMDYLAEVGVAEKIDGWRSTLASKAA